MVCAHQTRVELRLAIPSVRHRWRESAVSTSPVVVRNEIEVVVERRLGLLPDDLEDLIDGREPVVVHKRFIFGGIVVRPRELEEPAERVDFVLSGHAFNWLSCMRHSEKSYLALEHCLVVHRSVLWL